MKEFITAEKIAEMLISGVISCAIALAVNCIIEKYKNKKRADVDKTPTQDNISERSDENLSDVLKYADIHDNTNCDIQVNIYTDPEKDQ